MKQSILVLPLLFMALSLVTSSLRAEEAVVDKVYHPYVIANEQELEWRFTSRQNDDGNVLSQRLAYGLAVSEYVSVEGYLVFERDQTDDFGLQGYEVETRWMLTEQGQYWADWGMLFELEKEHQQDNWETSAGLLVEKEFTYTSLTLNMILNYQWGKNIEDELKPEFRLKYRYRWLPEIQPAIELYSGEGYTGIGPAFMGVHRYQGSKQLKWELGFIAGLNGNSKDHTLRFALEWEF